MGKIVDPALKRAREIFRMLPKDRPALVKVFIDALYEKGLIGKKDPEGGLFGKKLSPQDFMTGCAYYVQAVEGISCDHPTYGLASLPKHDRRMIEEIVEKLAQQDLLRPAKADESAQSEINVDEKQESEELPYHDGRAVLARGEKLMTDEERAHRGMKPGEPGKKKPGTKPNDLIIGS